MPKIGFLSSTMITCENETVLKTCHIFYRDNYTIKAFSLEKFIDHIDCNFDESMEKMSGYAHLSIQSNNSIKSLIV